MRIIKAIYWANHEGRQEDESTRLGASWCYGRFDNLEVVTERQGQRTTQRPRTDEFEAFYDYI